MGLAWCFQDKAQTLQQLLQRSLWSDAIVCRYLLWLFWDPEIRPLPESINFIAPWIHEFHSPQHLITLFPLLSSRLSVAFFKFKCHSLLEQFLCLFPPTLKKINQFILWMIIYVSIPESKHKTWHRKEHLSDQHFCSPQFPSISPFIKASCLWL